MASARIRTSAADAGLAGVGRYGHVRYAERREVVMLREADFATEWS